MASAWLMLLPVAGGAWWLLGFPPGWGWLVQPVMPGQPVSLGLLLEMVLIVVGLYGGLAWWRNNM